MNKTVMLTALFSLLFLVACSGQSGEIAILQETISQLEAEIDSNRVTINLQGQDISELQSIIYELESQDADEDTLPLEGPEDTTPQSETQNQDDTTPPQEILISFMEYLTAIKEFLGVDELYVAQEDITLQGNILTAYSDSFFAGGIRLLLRYSVWNERINWTLIEYTIGPITGPGFLDAGRSAWQWQQGELFDGSFYMRFHIYEDINPEPIGSYVEETITPQDWQHQVRTLMCTHLDIQLVDIWYEGTRLVVDITPASAIPFNWGSTGGAVLTLTLINTLASMPNVTEIEVLVGGQRGMWADHFSFADTFIVNQ